MNFKLYKGAYVRDDERYTRTDRSMVRDCLKHYTEFSLDENSVVLDLGANCGGFTHMCKNVKFYEGIDPLEDNVLCALENAKGVNGTVKLAAVSENDNDTISFYIRRTSSRYACSSTTKPFAFKNTEEVIVPNVNIFKLLEREDWTHIKIDVEGAERDFLNEKFIESLPESTKEISLELHSNKYCCQYPEKQHKLFEAAGFELVNAYLNVGFAGDETKTIFGQEYNGSLFGLDLFYRKK